MSTVVNSPTLDVAVLELGARPWAQDWDPPRYGRVDRSRAGVLEDCQAIGYPLFQLDPGERQRNTAELHGHIRPTDEAESGYLLMRDADLTTVSVPDFPAGPGESGGTGGSPLGGLSGALVFHQGYALGIVVEHHPRQGPTAVRILPVDRIAAATAPGAPSVAAALGLPEVTGLRQLTGEPLDPMAELLAGGPPADAVQALAGEPGSPGWSVTARFVDTALRGPGGDLPFAGRDAELAMLDGWLADPDGSPYHLVTGTARAGKTTLLARWSASQAARGGDWRVIFVPVTARYEASSGLEVYRALVHRLAAVHGVPYSRTAGFTDYRDQVTALLTQGAPDRSGVLVLIDGLDEASDWMPGARDFPARPGARVRVLLSARQTGQRPTAQSWLAALELDAGACGTTELAALRPAGPGWWSSRTRGRTRGWGRSGRPRADRCRGRGSGRTRLPKSVTESGWERHGTQQSDRGVHVVHPGLEREPRPCRAVRGSGPGWRAAAPAIGGWSCGTRQIRLVTRARALGPGLAWRLGPGGRGGAAGEAEPAGLLSGQLGVAASTASREQLCEIRLRGGLADGQRRPRCAEQGFCAGLSRLGEQSAGRGRARPPLDQRREGRVSVWSSRFPPGGCRVRGAAFDNTVNAETLPWEDDMKYIALLYGEPDAGPAPGTPEFMEMLGEFQSATQAMADAGILVDSSPLQPPQTATTVRVRDGETLLSDGPFAEIKEQLGGYYIVDCEDLDAALRYAAMIPSAKYGSVEVRPVLVMGPG